MKATTDPKHMLAAYQDSMELVECIRARELKAMTDEEALRIIQSLVAFEEPWRDRPDWSGLVEQQAYFHRRKP